MKTDKRNIIIFILIFLVLWFFSTCFYYIKKNKTEINYNPTVYYGTTTGEIKNEGSQEEKIEESIEKENVNEKEIETGYILDISEDVERKQNEEILGFTTTIQKIGRSSECRIYSGLYENVWIRTCDNGHQEIDIEGHFNNIQGINEVKLQNGEIHFPPKQGVDYRVLIPNNDSFSSNSYGKRYTDYDDYYDDVWYVYEGEEGRDWHIDDYYDETGQR